MTPEPPTAATPNTPLGVEVDRLLARLRNELQRAIAGRIGWLVIAAAALGGWLFLVLDRLAEPLASVRLGVELMLLAVGAGWLLVVATPRLTRRIEDRELLTLLHRQHPLEANLIATSLDQRGVKGGNPALREATIADADLAARSLGDVTLVRSPATTGSAWFASVAMAAALAFAAARPDLAACYARRVALADAPWPRRVELAVEGFQRDPASGEWRRVVARGEPTEFEVIAAVAPGAALPETLWARGGRAGGRRSLSTLTRVGAPVEGDAVRQRYRRRIERLDEDLTFSIRGGDGRLRLRLVAADRPQLTDLVVRCDPPAYLGAPSTTTGATTLGALPEGGVATIEAGASKRLATITATCQGGAGPAAAPLPASVEDNGERIVAQTPPLGESLVVTLVATDVDGLESEPIELPIEVAKDTPPSVGLTLDGVGRAVTRDARLPVRVRLEDDHGVADVQLELHSDEKVVVVPLGAPRRSPQTVPGEADLLSLRSADPSQRLVLQPGDRLRLVATAQDHYDLAERPRSESRTIEIEIVPPAELLARLGDAQRELRATLEALRSDIERLDYEIDLQRRRVEAPEAADEAIGRWGAERLLDTRKIADGVGEAATRADGLRRQVVNNRLEQPDLVDRLDRRVVRPLRAIQREHLAGAAEAIERASEGLGAGELAAAAAGVRTTKAEIERVLASLDTQQTYNEVVALLRGLIREQQSVNEKTARQESDSVRSLFD